MKAMKITLSNSHVNNMEVTHTLAILNLLQDIEGIHINSLAIFNKYLKENNIGVFLKYRQIDIIKRPKIFSEVTLSTYPFLTKPATGYRYINMLDSKGDLLLETIAYGIFVNLDNYSLVRLPNHIIASIKDEPLDESLDIKSRKINYNQEKNTLIGKQKIKRSYIDRYNHVNNSYYIQMALDELAEEIDFNRIRVEYLKAFLKDDECYIYLNEQNKTKTIVILKNSLNEVSAVIEFSKQNFIKKD